MVISGVIILLLVFLIYLYPQIIQPPKPTELGNTVITLKRTVCYGICPIYKLTIYENGRVVYEGEEFVNVAGTQTSQISQDKVKELVDEFYRINYFSLKDSYSYMDEMCATDHPSAITSITIDGKTKTIDNDHGCPSPKELRELENKIDEITNSKKWIKSE